MITTLTGENAFGLKNELDKLVTGFVAEHGDLALERVDGAEADFARIQEAITSLPFLASKKMVVLRTPGANKQFAESAEKLLAEASDAIDIVIVEPKLDKRLSYYKFLKSKTDFRSFPALDQNGLAQWLVRSAKDRGGSISSGDARYLVERVGPNQLMLGHELDKLLIYEPKISRENIDLLSEAAPQSTIFQLLEAGFDGNSRRAMELYDEQRALKVEAPQIIAMLAWQLHVLAIIKTGGDRSPDQIAQEAKLNPFVVRKSQNIARLLSLAELKKLIAELLKIDVRSKRENIDPDEALKHYLLSLAELS
ncbi:MAG TPA: DNA polymerase III subunit delta [Candidatus Saccharimonadales bacterium]|nr:DNA polymerase III subunit delta [Candidatus Saccharimonadales bacterium]